MKSLTNWPSAVHTLTRFGHMSSSTTHTRPCTSTVTPRGFRNASATQAPGCGRPPFAPIACEKAPSFANTLTCWEPRSVTNSRPPASSATSTGCSSPVSISGAAAPPEILSTCVPETTISAPSAA
ncbi:MAG: hypothetical protein BWZ02_03338 [Lentisphaerae bacterium ADurb.BinA184]|nr:MAG: hypothetical protein BWZ02_03338 [Lentisphaerae bacterium ADurb.BinA184]